MLHVVLRDEQRRLNTIAEHQGQDDFDHMNQYFGLQMHGPDQLPFPFGDERSRGNRFYNAKSEHPCPICYMYRTRTGRRPDFCDVCRNIPECGLCHRRYPKTGTEEIDGFWLGNGLRVVEYVGSNRPDKEKAEPKGGNKARKGKRRSSQLGLSKDSAPRASVSRVVTLTYDELDELKHALFPSETGPGFATSVSSSETCQDKETQSLGINVCDWTNFGAEISERMKAMTERMDESDKECIEAHNRMKDLLKNDQASDWECTEALVDLFSRLTFRQQLLSESARVIESWSEAVKKLSRLSAMKGRC